MNDITILNQDGNLVVSSREVAENFKKEHKDVLETIRNLMAENFAVKNIIIESEYTNSRGRVYPEFLLTRDGFSLLVMGFTGKKALEWKLKYIDAFNKMEKIIIEQQKQITSLTKQQEIEARLNNSKVRQANVYLKIADKIDIPEYQQIMYSKATEVLSGKQLLPLPKTERTYTATEIAKEMGSTPQMIGRIANKNNLKTEKYGIEVWDKSPYSAKQVSSWRYNEEGRKKLIEILGGIIDE